MNKLAFANLLDAVADHYDSITVSGLQQKVAARQTLLNKVAEAHLERHGTDLPAAVREKLASMDEEVLELFLKTANNGGGSPDSLGAPTDDSPTTKIASDDADAIFLARING